MNSLQLQPLRIPFKQRFKHAAASRNATESLWVEAISPAGTRGYGEGCPREYVTGETVESASRFFREIEAEAAALLGAGELRQWVAKNRARVDANPAAWCAIELALLDLFARENHQSVEALLSLPVITGPFHYTAVLGAESAPVFEEQLDRYVHMGFRDFKVKLSGDPAADQQRAHLLQSRSGRIGSVRLDANNLWRDAPEAIRFIHALGPGFFAVEEPLTAGDYAGLRRVGETLGVGIVLDESFIAIEQFERLGALPARWIINLRVSKMGGLLRSLAIIEEAARIGVPIIVGCQVGETSLLTRAALTIAQAAKGRGLIAQEGAFGTHLLTADVVARPLMFGPGGRLDVAAHRLADAPGFGLEISGVP